MTVNREAQSNPIYAPEYVGLVRDIYRFYDPIDQETAQEQAQVIMELPVRNRYSGVLYNPRISEIQYILSLIAQMGNKFTELDALFELYYNQTDFDCHDNIEKPCGCPEGMVLQNGLCVGDQEVSPTVSHPYNSLVQVSTRHWGSDLNRLGVTVSADGRNPYLLYNTSYSLYCSIDVPVPGTYTLKYSSDDSSKYYFNGVLKVSAAGDRHKGWLTETFTLDAGQNLMLIEVHNIDIPGQNSWANNPTAVGFELFSPGGQLVINSRDSRLRVVPFTCGPGELPNLNTGRCLRRGSTVPCTPIKPVPCPNREDYNYWNQVKGTGMLLDEDLEELRRCLERFRTWTNRLTANWSSFLGIAQHDVGMRNQFQGIDDPCAALENYLGSLEEPGEGHLDRIAEILLGFQQTIDLIKRIINSAINGSIDPNGPPGQCPKFDAGINASSGWILSGGVLTYHGVHATPANLNNGTIQFTTGALWNPQRYLDANPDVAQSIARGDTNNCVQSLYPSWIAWNDSRWCPELNATAIWPSQDGTTPYSTSEEVVLKVTFVLESASNHTLEYAGDNIYRFLLNGAQVATGNSFTTWQSVSVNCIAGQNTLEIRISNLDVNGSNFNSNPGGIGFLLKKSSGQIVLNSRNLASQAGNTNVKKYLTHSKVVHVGPSSAVWVTEQGNVPAYWSVLGRWVSVAWRISIPSDGIYTFWGETDDQMKIYVDEYSTPRIHIHIHEPQTFSLHLQAGTHHIMCEGYNVVPRHNRDFSHNPASINVTIAAPNGNIIWTTRSTPPIPVICEDGFNPDPVTGSCVACNLQTAETHYINHGAREGRCIANICPAIIPNGHLRPYIDMLSGDLRSQLRTEIERIYDRMTRELENIARATIRLDRLSVAGMVNQLPDDPCAKRFLEHTVMPNVAHHIRANNDRRTEVVPTRPESQLVPLPSAPQWRN